MKLIIIAILVASALACFGAPTDRLTNTFTVVRSDWQQFKADLEYMGVNTNISAIAYIRKMIKWEMDNKRVEAIRKSIMDAAATNQSDVVVE